MLVLLAALTMDAALDRQVEAAPVPVRMFIERRGNCNHWTGEEPYDADRAAQIRAAAIELRCRFLARDEKRLRARYARQPRILTLLSATQDWGGN